jgi:hypothetical protein
LSTEDENSRDSPGIDIQLNVIPHLSRGDSEYYLKKSLSTNTFVPHQGSPDYDHKQIKNRLTTIERSVSLTHKYPHYSFPQRTNDLVHMEHQSGKLILSKGDEFNNLPEDEM